MELWWVWGDSQTETHLRRIELPTVELDGEIPRVRMLRVPAEHFSIAEMTDRTPDLGWHPAPRRQFLTIMSGECEITSSDGASARLVPGDCVLADDVGTRGHLTRQLGDQPLTFGTVEVPADWSFDG